MPDEGGRRSARRDATPLALPSLLAADASLLIDSIRAIVWQADSSFRFSFVSRHAETILGFPISTWIEDPDRFRTRIHPDDRDLYFFHLTRALLALEEREFEFRFFAADERIVWLRDRVRVAPGEGGDVQLFGLMIDVTEQKLAEEALRRSNERFELAARATGDMLYDWDLQSNLLWRNTALQTLFGYPASAIRDDLEWWTEKIHPDDREPTLTRLQAAILGPASFWSGEYRFRRVDGTYAPVVDRGYFLRDASGRASRMIGALTDLTELRRAEEALVDNEARFRALIQNSTDAILLVDPAATLRYASPAIERILGYTPAEVLGMKAFDYIHPEDRRAMRKSVREVVADPGARRTNELRVRHRDGSWRWTESIVTNRLDHPAIRAFVINYRDITDRKAAEDAARQTEQQYRRIFEAASDAMLIVDLEGRIVECNPAGAAMHGCTREEMIGALGRDFIDPSDHGKFFEFLDSANRGVDYYNEAVDVMKDGTPFHVEVHGTPFEFQGNPHLLAVLRNVSRQKLLENQLERANRMASLGRLAATIAHEINNVMMGIQPFIDMIRRDAASDPAHLHAASRIAESVQRGKRITQEILRYTRPSEPILKQILVADWFRLLLPEAEPLVGPGIAVRATAPPGIAILADHHQLYQVLTNLIANARDAIGEAGSISVEARNCRAGESFPFGIVESSERFVHVTVRDDGCGMSPETMRHIFEPLFTTKKAGGTGLGLAVVHQIVKKHSGEVFVESVEGKGTAFHLFLPKAEAPLPEAAKAGVVARSCITRLLLVEDEEAVAAGLAAILEIEGVAVRVVHRAAGTEAAIAEFDPEVLVLDLGLPDMNGAELYRAIRRSHPNLPVVFSTGHGDESAIADLLRLPQVTFLLKPYDFETLLAAIARVVAP